MPRIKPAPIEIHGAVDDDDAVVESNVAVEAAEVPRDYLALEAFVAAIGPNRLVSQHEWMLAAAINQSVLLSALAEHELCVINRLSDPTGDARESGIKAVDLLRWAQKRNIEYSMTAVAHAVLNSTPAELVRASTYSLGSAVAELGIDAAALKAALLAGELRQGSDSNIGASESRIEASSLLDWIEANAITLRPTISLAATIVRERFRGDSVSAPANDTPQSIFADALRILNDTTASEADAKAANERAMRTRYVAVLRRRQQPHQDDATDLAELCRQLGLGVVDLERDAAVLEAADRLEAQTLLIADVTSELEAAGEDFRATTKRHEMERKATYARLREAQRTHSLAVRAPLELQALCERRPDLFV